MGFLEVLASIPRAITEKARSDEFGPDYRQRWQKYQDEHVRSELQNAISNTEQQDKARKAAAEMYAAGVGKAPGTPPEEAMGENLAEDRSLGNRLKQANISYLEQKPDLAREGMASREEVASQSLALRRELAATQDETRRAMLGLQIERLKDIENRFQERQRNPSQWGKDAYGGTKGYYDNLGSWHDVQPPGGAGEAPARTTAIPASELKALGSFMNVDVSLDKIEKTLQRVKDTSWTSPVQKAFALQQFKADAQGLGGLALGRAVGEVGVFTNQDRTVYAGIIAPSLTALAAGNLGADEAEKRIREIRDWIKSTKGQISSRFQQRYGFVPTELGDGVSGSSDPALSGTGLSPTAADYLKSRGY
jgi:hypothetical protein